MKKTLPIIVLVATGILIVSVATGWMLSKKNSPTPITQACTEEAKLCPDGSYVGRSGPDCTFTACPKETASDAWKSITDSATGITFQYPEKLATEYIHATAWPPKISMIQTPFACAETGTEVGQAGKTENRVVAGHPYCVTKASEGAAGSVYTTYTYTVPKNGKTVAFSFSLQAVQCTNYDEPKKTACENERSTFDIDALVDRMAESVVVK